VSFISISDTIVSDLSQESLWQHQCGAMPSVDFDAEFRNDRMILQPLDGISGLLPVVGGEPRNARLQRPSESEGCGTASEGWPL
jgi:hypothetical protein